MKLKNIATAFAIASTLMACNDSFMERNPVTSLTEENAFQTYDNFKAYMYQCYNLFTDNRITSNFCKHSINHSASISAHSTDIKRDPRKDPSKDHTSHSQGCGSVYLYIHIVKIGVAKEHLLSLNNKF